MPAPRRALLFRPKPRLYLPEVPPVPAPLAPHLQAVYGQLAQTALSGDLLALAATRAAVFIR